METTPKPDWVTEKYGTDYEELVGSWGHEVLSFDTIGSYQGDHLVLLRDGDRYGIVVIGYGSCSGCDALQAVGPRWSPCVTVSTGTSAGTTPPTKPPRTSTARWRTLTGPAGTCTTTRPRTCSAPTGTGSPRDW